jgi:hypothetical protein
LQGIAPGESKRKAMNVIKNENDSVIVALRGSFLLETTLNPKRSEINTEDLKKIGAKNWVWFEYYLPLKQ